MLVDNGLEFAHNFSRGVELQVILLHITNRMSPLENCLAERHIGVAKDILEKKILTQQISSLEALDNLISTLQSSKNSRPIHGGVSPSQNGSWEHAKPSWRAHSGSLLLHGIRSGDFDSTGRP